MEKLFDTRDPETLAEPYDHYRRLRSAEPVHLTEFDDGVCAVPIVLLSRWSDCAAVLRDPRFTAEKDFARMMGSPGAPAAEDDPVVAAFNAVMLFRDPPAHTRIRSLVNKAFTPRRVEALAPRIQQIVDELLEPLETDGGMDLIHDLAAPLPVMVIAELLGLPAEDHEQLKVWSDRVATLIDGSLRADNQEEAVKNLFEVSAYLGRILADRKREPRDDLISAMVAAQERDDRLTDTEVFATCLLILGAGHETTTNLIGNGLKALLEHPEERRRLADDPGLIRSAIEELLRYDSPVQVTSRVPKEDVVIDGVPIEAGVEVNTLIGAANRDPEQFENPEALDLGRADNRHLAFGFGAHFCLGAPLARLEGQLAIATLLQRFPGLAASGQPKRRPGFVLRGFESLPLRF